MAWTVGVGYSSQLWRKSIIYSSMSAKPSTVNKTPEPRLQVLKAQMPNLSEGEFGILLAIEAEEAERGRDTSKWYTCYSALMMKDFKRARRF